MKVWRSRGLAALATVVLVFFGGSAGALGLHPSAEAVTPLPVGAQVPTVSVRTITGEPVELAALVAERGALLVFYRGGW